LRAVNPCSPGNYGMQRLLLLTQKTAQYYIWFEPVAHIKCDLLHAHFDIVDFQEQLLIWWCPNACRHHWKHRQ